MRRKSITSFLGFLAISIGIAPALCDAAGASQSDLIPRRTFFSSVSSDLILSPDGERIAYGRPSINRVRPTFSAQDETKIRLQAKGTTANVRWAYTNRHLLFEKRRGNARQVVSYDIETNEERDLSGGIGIVASIAALSPAMPSSVLLRIESSDTEHELWRVDLERGESARVISLPASERVFVDAQLRPVVLERRHGLCEAELLRRGEDGTWQVFRTLACDYTNIDGRATDGYRRVLGVNDVGTTLYIIDATGRDKTALLSVDLTTNREEVLASHAYADLWPDVLRDASTGSPLACFAQFGDRQYTFFDSAIETGVAFLEKHFGTQVDVAQRSLDGSTWIVTPLDGGPPRFFAYRPGARKVEFLLPQVAAFEGVTLADRSSHIVETRDGLKIPCHLYLPPGADGDGNGVPDEPLPTLIYVHGGPSSFLEWDGWNGNAIRCQQLLANRGYAAFRVEFRGSGGFGKNFREKGNQEWGRASLDDVVDIAQWAIESGIAQRDKIGIWGFSYGGHAALSALAHHSDIFACGFSWSGPSDLEARVAQWVDTEYVDLLREGLGDERTEEGRAALRRQSPIHFVEGIQKPLLIVHGGKDTAVPVQEQIDPLVEELAELDKDFTYAFFPKEGHGFSQSASWNAVWAIAERFFATHLGGRFEPFGRDVKAGPALEVPNGIEFVPGLSQILGGTL